MTDPPALAEPLADVWTAAREVAALEALLWAGDMSVREQYRDARCALDAATTRLVAWCRSAMVPASTYLDPYLNGDPYQGHAR